MRDCLGNELKVGDYCFSDIIKHNFYELELLMIERFTPKMVVLKKHNKPKSKIIYKYPKMLIKVNMENYPEYFLWTIKLSTQVDQGI